jgi:hypothetical protein
MHSNTLLRKFVAYWKWMYEMNISLFSSGFIARFDKKCLDVQLHVFSTKVCTCILGYNPGKTTKRYMYNCTHIHVCWNKLCGACYNVVVSWTYNTIQCRLNFISSFVDGGKCMHHCMSRKYHLNVYWKQSWWNIQV